VDLGIAWGGDGGSLRGVGPGDGVE
jgi:hypothetical protein